MYFIFAFKGFHGSKILIHLLVYEIKFVVHLFVILVILVNLEMLIGGPKNLNKLFNVLFDSIDIHFAFVFLSININLINFTFDQLFAILIVLRKLYLCY